MLLPLSHRDTSVVRAPETVSNTSTFQTFHNHHLKTEAGRTLYGTLGLHSNILLWYKVTNLRPAMDVF